MEKKQSEREPPSSHATDIIRKGSVITIITLISRPLGYVREAIQAYLFGATLLVDAFIELKRDPALKDLRLRATGGCTDADRTFVESIRAKLRASGVEESVEFLSDFRKPQRREFLRSLSVLSVPVPQGEASGVELLEAMAHGVPVVQPRVGSYPEIIAATGGGILCEPANPAALAAGLAELLRDPARARKLGETGRQAVAEKFSVEAMSRQVEDILERVRKTK